jgi:uncharacterized protein (TIGR00251 family)
VPAWRIDGDAIVVAVRVTPRGGRDAIDGVARLADGSEVVRARVRAAPHEGAANAAIVALLATTFSRPRSAVAVVGGAAARVKQVRIGGDVAALVRIAAGLPRL